MQMVPGVNGSAQRIVPGAEDRNERAKGLEPSPEAWKAAVLPLHYARVVITDDSVSEIPG